MKIMGIDLGKKRTGIAISDISGSLASPFCVLSKENMERLVEEIKAIVKRENVGEIVVGLPRNMDGSEGESAKRARDFSNRLSEETNLNVVLSDERNTTISAHGYLNLNDVRGKKRKAIIDSVAATIILQDYLDYRRNNNG